MISPDPALLAVPNISEGRDERVIEAISQAFTDDGRAKLLDRHSDVDHHRSVLSLLGAPGALGDALLCGARETVARINVGSGRSGSEIGQHPHVGALDVMPVVYLDPRTRGAATAEALVVAHRIGAELAVPVFLYGEIGAGRTRAQLRRGGLARLVERMRSRELIPDFGPRRAHPTAGATLVAARAPLVAFNLELAPPAAIDDARRIAGLIREGAREGLPGLRAIGISLRGERVAQVSMNVERPLEVPLSMVVEAVRRHAEVSAAEIVGLVPRAALEGFPADLPLPGFDAAHQVIENALGL